MSRESFDSRLSIHDSRLTHQRGWHNGKPQRITHIGLRNFAVYGRVQLSRRATLPAVDERLLRSKLEQAIRREGMSIVGGNNVRHGAGAHLSLLYTVTETRDRARQETGFAALSCLQAEQTVSLPRLGRNVYAVKAYHASQRCPRGSSAPTKGGPGSGRVGSALVAFPVELNDCD